ncbi:MAG TPA: RsmD family RNA methyltransferase, partial [Verrucomicrobiota bacterium]|nr:RsmD family RNA methyltransferase [Verrucomicrobiota bacterium]
FVTGTRVLDLFAGTGALGNECLSRGASSVLSVEKSAHHARFYRQNLAALGLPDTAVELWVMDAFGALRRLAESGRRFDLVIADPPYGEKNLGRRSDSLAQRLLDAPELPGLLAEGGRFVLGHTKRDTLELGPAWSERRQLRHGDTIIRVLQPAANRGAVTSPGGSEGHK